MADHVVLSKTASEEAVMPAFERYHWQSLWSTDRLSIRRHMAKRRIACDSSAAIAETMSAVVRIAIVRRTHDQLRLRKNSSDERNSALQSKHGQHAQARQNTSDLYTLGEAILTRCDNPNNQDSTLGGTGHQGICDLRASATTKPSSPFLASHRLGLTVGQN